MKNQESDSFTNKLESLSFIKSNKIRSTSFLYFEQQLTFIEWKVRNKNKSKTDKLRVQNFKDNDKDSFQGI